MNSITSICSLIVRSAAAGLALLLATPSGVRAQSAAFDLAGPTLTMRVTRGDTTLPIAQVPTLAAGDRLGVRVLLPEDQSARYTLVVAFLRGATNPPPKSWFHRLDTWKRRPSQLDITVPEGAQQAIAFLAPSTGGGYDALVSAVRGRPGAFVRASQDLGQSALDRSRLQVFLDGISRAEAAGAGSLETVSPVLARSLAIRWNGDCLQRQPALQAACLTQNRESLILHDGRRTTLTETLTGAPTDLAFRLSNTREAGSGFYSPYIAIVRDLARLLGGFRTAQYQYIPALTLRQGDEMQLLLNTAPSFRKPHSVLVAGLPLVEAVQPPPLRVAAPAHGICATRPGLVLPVEGAPLFYGTSFARDLSLRVEFEGGETADLPVTPDATKGGFVLRDRAPSNAGARRITAAAIRGHWGFEPFVGPSIDLRAASSAAWQAAQDTSLVIGRDNRLVLRGGATACVEEVVLQRGSEPGTALKWEPTGTDAIAVTLPLASARPGKLRLQVRHAGERTTSAITLTAFDEPSRIDEFRLHAGDTSGVLVGNRLDQVAALTVGAAEFTPGEVRRDGKRDELVLIAAGELTADQLAPGEARVARVKLRDGRTSEVRFSVAPPRPAASLIEKSFEQKLLDGTLHLELLGDDAVPQTGCLAFSLRAAPGTRLRASDIVEIATADGSASTRLSSSNGVSLQGASVAVATFLPLKALGPSAVGPLRFRIIQGDVSGDWTPLATLVRVPEITEVACAAGAQGCTLRGNGLFLISRVSPASDLVEGVDVPEGYTGAALTVPRAKGSELYLRLRDAEGVFARVRLAD